MREGGVREYIIRKNATSIFLEVKVRDLVVVQRRNAGRRRRNKKTCEATKKRKLRSKRYGKMR